MTGMTIGYVTITGIIDQFSQVPEYCTTKKREEPYTIHCRI